MRVFIQNSSRKLQLYFLLMLFLYSVVQNLFNYYIPNLSVRINALNYFVFYICYFMAGFYLKTFKLASTKLAFSIILFIATVCLTAIQAYSNGKTPWIYSYDYLSYNVVMMTVLLFTILNSLNDHLGKQHDYLCKVVKNIASTTLGIYAIHIIVKELLSRGVWGLSISISSNHLLLSVPVTILMVFLVSFLITSIGMKIPLLNKVFGGSSTFRVDLEFNGLQSTRNVEEPLFSVLSVNSVVKKGFFKKPSPQRAQSSQRNAHSLRHYVPRDDTHHSRPREKYSLSCFSLCPL